MALVLSSISGSIQSNSSIGLSGSVVIANRPDGLFPSLPGDATFFVSGSSSSDYAVFGGSVVGSGSLQLKNESGATQFNAAATGVTVSDSSGTSKFTVASSTGNTVVQGTLQSVGVLTATGGISGSHTKLTDGSSAFIGGSNVTITTGSNGAITIAASMNAAALVAGADTQLQFNDGGAFGGDAGLTYNKTTDTLTVAGDVAVNGGDLTSSAATFNLVNSGVTTLNLGGAATAVEIGAATGTTSINNSLTVDGNVTLGDAAADTVTVNGTTTFAGSGVTTTFAGDVAVNGGDLTSSATTFNLVNSGVTTLNLGGAATAVEIGAATGTTSVNNALTVDGKATFNQGISGSLTKLADGSSYLVAGNNVSIVTGSNGSVTISTQADLTSITAGNGLTGGGSAGDVTLTVDDSKVAMTSGSTFTGAVKFNAGLSGSLTKLTDGSSYLVAGSNIVVTTGSNGSITIAGTMNASTLVAGTDTQIQFNDGGSNFGGDAGLTYNKTTDTLTGVTGSFFSLSTSGNSSVGGGLTVTGASTLNGNVTVGDASADTITVNGTTTFAGAAVTTTFAGNATVSGNTTLGDAAADTVTVNGTTTFAGSGVTTTFAGDVAVNGGDMTSSAATFNLVNSGVTTLNLGGAATAVAIGAATGTTTVNNGLTVTGAATLNGNVTVGDASADTVTVNGTTTFAGAAVTTTFAGDVAVNGGDVTSSATTFNLLNSTVTTLNVGGAATAVTLGATTGTTTIKNSLTVSGSTVLGDASSDTLSVNGFATFNNGLIGSLTSSNVTSGQVVVGGTGGLISGSNQLFWHNTSGSLGIGTTQPTGKLEVAGSNGSLFVVTDSVSGSLLSVNNSSGLAILEVLSDNRVIAGAPGANALVVSGSRVAVGTTPANTTGLLVSGSSTSSDKVLLVKAGVAGQTGALVDVQNSAGSSVFIVSNTGISGSHTKLADGTSAFIAGTNVTVTTGSTGAITISAAMNAGALVGGSDTQLQFNDGGAFGGDSGLTYNKTTDTLTGVSGSFFSLSTSGNSSVGGALTVTGASTLNGNVTVGDASADTVTVNGTTTFAGAAVTTTFAGDVAVNGGDMTSSAATFNLVNSGVTTLNLGGAATAVAIGAATGTTTVNNGLTVTGAATLNGNVTVGDASADTVTVNGTTTFAGSGVTTTFAGDVAVNGGDVTSSATTFNLLNATVTTLNLGGAATAIEIGAATGTTSINNALTVDGNTTLGNAASDSLTVNGAATFNQGLSGSLTKLSDGSSYLVGGSNISIVTGSNGAVTISTTADITSVTAGTGLTGGGSTGDLTLGINDSVVATVSGTTFTGAVKFNAGLSGSLTKLTDGSSAFLAGNNVTITTGSNGSVTIAASMNAAALVAGTDTQIQFNDGGAFGADSGLTYNKTTDTLTGVTGSFFGLSTSGDTSVGGALTVTGASTLNGNVTVGDASADTVTVNGTTTFAGAAVTTTFAGDVAVNGGDMTSTAATFNLVNSGVTTLNFGGAATAVEIGASTGTTSVNNNLTVENGSVAIGTGSAGGARLYVSSSATGAESSAFIVGAIFLGNSVNVSKANNSLFNLADGTEAGRFNASGISTPLDLAVNGGDMTSTATTFNLLNATVTTLNVGGAATTVEIGAATGTTSVNNNLTVDGNTTLGNANTDTVTFTSRVSSDVLPSADVTYSLGSSTNRWANIYTGDLHLKNDRGDYTLIEEEDFLTIRFNKSGKRYKFMLEAVPELDEEIGNFSSGPKPSV